MTASEADNLRKSNRMIMKEGSVIESVKLTDSDLTKEQIHDRVFAPQISRTTE